MNTENTIINSKEKSNQEEQHPEINTSKGYRYISFKSALVIVLIFGICLCSVLYMKSNNNAINIQLTNGDNTVVSAPVKINMKERANRRLYIKEFFVDLLKKNPEITFQNYTEEKYRHLFSPIIEKINSMNEQFPDEVADVFKEIQNKVESVNIMILKINEKLEKDKKTKEQEELKRFLQIPDYCVGCDPEGEYSFSCCLKCDLCCTCPDLWVNPNDPDLTKGTQLSKWSDFYRLQEIQTFLPDVYRYATDNISATNLSCPIFDLFQWECLPKIGYLCHNYPEDYFKCNATDAQWNLIMECQEWYYEERITYQTYQICILENVGMCLIY